MALPKLFQRIFWHNNTTPAINEDNLNAISKGLSDVDDRVIELATDVMEKIPELEDLAEQLEEGIQNPPYIGANGNWYIWNTTTQQYVDSGVDASISVNIADVTMLAEGATPYVTNTGTNTDPVFHLFIPRGATGATGVTPNITMSATADDTSSANPSVQVTKSGTAEAPSFALAFSGLKGTKGDTGNTGATGATGNGISSITKTGTQGLVDTYTIIMTDGSTATFTVTNGQDGQGAGDMLKSTYDGNNDVANAGGIPSYVSGEITGKMDKANPTGTGSFSLNRKANTSIGQKSVALGTECEASGDWAFAIGFYNTASGNYSFAGGGQSIASNFAAHAEGTRTLASGVSAVAFGEDTTAAYNHQMVVGKDNSNKSTTLFEVGNGQGSAYKNNAFEVYDDGSLSTDNGSTKTKLPVIRSATLAANATQVIISNVPNTGTNLVEFYTSVPGLDYTAISVSGTDVTLTYDAQATATTVYAVITEVTS